MGEGWLGFRLVGSVALVRAVRQLGGIAAVAGPGRALSCRFAACTAAAAVAAGQGWGSSLRKKC